MVHVTQILEIMYTNAERLIMTLTFDLDICPPLHGAVLAGFDRKYMFVFKHKLVRNIDFKLAL